MGSKTPPLEETKAIILKAKGPAWLAAAEQKFEKSYGTRYEPALKLWLIAKQGGLDVAEIRADSSGGEGQETLIHEIIEKGKGVRDGQQGKNVGWTHVNGGKFDQPDQQGKYSITGVVLFMEEGTTSTNKPKLDLTLTDGTGVAKLVAYADAVDLFVEAHVVPGSIIKIPLCNVQFGFHNFGKKPNELWWKFAVPPFGSVVPLEDEVRNYFLNAETDALKEGMAAYTRGFITHVEETEQEVCVICNQWVLEKQPKKHDDCRKDEGFNTEMRPIVTGTGTAVNGQTHKLYFKVKPKVKIAVDELEIFGRVGRNGGLDVAFIRKAGTESPVATERPTAPVAKPKAASKPAPVESEEDAEGSDEPALPKPVKAAAKPKKAVPPPPPAEEEEAPEEEEPEPAPAPPVVVRRAAKSPPALPVAAASEAEIDVPDEIVQHVKKFTVNYGGKNRMFGITRPAGKAGLLGEGTDEQHKAKMESYVAALVANGTVEWTSAKKDEIKWLG